LEQTPSRAAKWKIERTVMKISLLLLLMVAIVALSRLAITGKSRDRKASKSPAEEAWVGNQARIPNRLGGSV
jgi:hypothetical protein